MSKKIQIFNKYSRGLRKTDPGFTLIEMVTVVAVLGILTSLSLFGTSGNNGIVSWSKRANIDATKALLNATAADCLQKSRISSGTTVDDTIISNEILESKGYIIDSTNTTCTSFGVKPINDTEALLFPMSFAIVSGKLTKSSQPTGPDSIPYCRKWAGILCTQGDALKDLVKHIAAIEKSKDTCDAALDKNKADKITAGPINKWNPNATRGCPTRPPVDTSSATCTTNGCLNNPVWLVEGIEYTSKADADAAETAIAGAKCIEGLSDKTDPSKGGNPTLTEQGVRPVGCKKDYYFAKGKRFDNETAWKAEMCSINIKQQQDNNYTDPSGPSKIEHCGDQDFYFCAGENKGNDAAYQACRLEDQSAKCAVKNDEIRQTGGNGKHPNDMEGPAPCGADFWVCDEVIVDKTEYEGKCESTPESICGKAPNAICDNPRFHGTITCTGPTDKTDNWSKCMGFI